MSEGMSLSSRALKSATSRLSSLKGYIGQPRAIPSVTSTQAPEEDGRATWIARAGQKIRLRRGNSDGASIGTETLSLFPGWAVRRYKPGHPDGEAFEVEVFVSGYATTQRPPEYLTRSQRAFIRLAKGERRVTLAGDTVAPSNEALSWLMVNGVLFRYASLPKLVPDKGLSRSTEDLLAQKQLPPTPSEIPDDYDLQALERQFQNTVTDSASPPSSRTPSPDFSDTLSTTTTTTDPATFTTSRTRISLHQLHANLERRLQPFWSSALSGRVVRITLFTSTSSGGPISTQDATTAADGSFQTRFTIPWDSLCQHEGGLHIAFGDHYPEHDLIVSAEVTPLPFVVPLEPDRRFEKRPELPPLQQQQQPHQVVVPAAPQNISIPITHSPIRVISDIDDTVKLSNILGGARIIFQNVFVRDLKENIIPGMGEFYTKMWDKGVRFHYVSNGPFEILPIVNEFIRISGLPLGSIKLKSYAGRSIFNGLLSAPATRKRAGVQDIIDSFPDSRFFLIGDSGEQDLELYSDLAAEYPSRILAVLIRDVEPDSEPIEDPTGSRPFQLSADLLSSPFSSVVEQPKPQRSLSALSGRVKAVGQRQSKGEGAGLDTEYFTAAQWYATERRTIEEPEEMGGGRWGGGVEVSNGERRGGSGSPRILPSSSRARFGVNGDGAAAAAAGSDSYQPTSPLSSSGPPLRPSLNGNGTTITSGCNAMSRGVLSDAAKRRVVLQGRVHEARARMPREVVLRVFRDPRECVEVEEIFVREEGQRGEGKGCMGR